MCLLLAFGVDYRSVNAPYIGSSLVIGSMEFSYRLLVPFLVSMAMFLSLQIFLSRTFIGRAVMAVSQDPLALRLMAVDPTRIKRIAFGISIATASLAGAFLIIIQPVIPSVGRDYIGRIFAICVLGGLGSLPGTLIAALLLGVIESFTSTFYGPSWAPAVSFGILLLDAGRAALRPAGTLAPCARPFSSCRDRGRRWRCYLLFRHLRQRLLCSSPATPCCNTSCWRPPGTSSAAIAAM